MYEIENRILVQQNWQFHLTENKWMQTPVDDWLI